MGSRINVPAGETVQNLLREIREFCREHADGKIAEKYGRFFTEGYDAYGIDPKVLTGKKAELLERSAAHLSLEEALELGGELVRSGKYEEAFFGFFLLEPLRKQYTPETFQRVGVWLETGISTWAHTDVLCGEILSYFFREGLVGLEEMAAWRESPSKWKRRAVPVAMLTLLKLEAPVERLLGFIDPLMTDSDRFVHQGLGWFLREAWKKHPEPVEAFLLRWKEVAARKIYQYATEKMTKEERGRFKRAGRH